MTRIGFVGVGNMGGPMARNLLAKGFALRAHDRDQAAVAAVAGAVACTSAADAARDVDMLVTMLPAGPQVAAVLGGEDGLIRQLAPGTLIVDCSTIDVATARALAAEAGARGLDMLDAPVSGGTGGAEAGTLTFMVGGSDAGLARARPALEAMGRTIVHCGGPGNGQAAKICNNLILGISMIGVSEAFVLANRLGLAHQTLFDVASKSSGQCWSLTSYCPVPGPVPTSPANRDYRPGFTAGMMLKDLRLAEGAGRAVGAETPLGDAAVALYDRLCQDDGAQRDFSAIYALLAERVKT
jgi:3-hydroxyisobutyrate dehydrogenase